MLTALATSTRLSRAIPHLDFQSLRSRPGWATRCPPTRTRTILPTLTYFWFQGVIVYFEDIVSRIDAPDSSLCLWSINVLYCPLIGYHILWLIL